MAIVSVPADNLLEMVLWRKCNRVQTKSFSIVEPAIKLTHSLLTEEWTDERYSAILS